MRHCSGSDFTTVSHVRPITCVLGLTEEIVRLVQLSKIVQPKALDKGMICPAKRRIVGNVYIQIGISLRPLLSFGFPLVTKFADALEQFVYCSSGYA